MTRPWAREAAFWCAVGVVAVAALALAGSPLYAAWAVAGVIAGSGLGRVYAAAGVLLLLLVGVDA